MRRKYKIWLVIIGVLLVLTIGLGVLKLFMPNEKEKREENVTNVISNIDEYGYSLDDKRTKMKEDDIPDIIRRFRNLEGETDRKRTEQSFFVEKKEIVENGYDLSINKYKEVEYIPVEYPPTEEIMDRIMELDTEIAREMQELRKML